MAFCPRHCARKKKLSARNPKRRRCASAWGEGERIGGPLPRSAISTVVPFESRDITDVDNGTSDIYRCPSGRSIRRDENDGAIVEFVVVIVVVWQVGWVWFGFLAEPMAVSVVSCSTCSTLSPVSAPSLSLCSFPRSGYPATPTPTTTFRATCLFILWHTTTREFPTSNDNIWIISALLVV